MTVWWNKLESVQNQTQSKHYIPLLYPLHTKVLLRVYGGRSRKQIIFLQKCAHSHII